MAIDKKEFQKIVLDMAAKPKNPKIKTEYFKQVQHMSEIIAKSYKITELDDMIQDLVEYSIKKRLHKRIRKSKSAFSYYWKSLSNHVWYLNQKRKRDPIRTFDMWENSYDDGGEGEETMIKRLSWSLDDYQGNDVEEILENMETVTMKRAKRGRPKIKKPGEKAAHWEYMFKILKKKKTMTEGALVKQLPAVKVKSLKNPEKSVQYYMRTIAHREGLHLSVTDDGKQKIYMLLGD